MSDNDATVPACCPYCANGYERHSDDLAIRDRLYGVNTDICSAAAAIQRRHPGTEVAHQADEMVRAVERLIDRFRTFANV